MIDPQVQIKIVSAVCSSFAIASTIQRLFIRIPGAGLWFDDAWAIFSTVVLIMQVGSVFMEVPNPPGVTGAARYYMMAIGFYSVIWTARLSILFSLIRIEPFNGWQRVYKTIGVVFFTIWMVLLAQLFWECEPGVEWKQLPSPQCKLGRSVPILQLTSDIFADLCLLWIPMRLFRSILNDNLRKRLMLIFSTCVATTIVSLVHASYIFVSGGPREIIAALVEDCVSLMVCNLPLCVAQVIRRGRWFEDEEPVSTNMWPTWFRKTTTTSSGTNTTRSQLRTTITNAPTTVISVDLPSDTSRLRPDESYVETHSMKNLGSHSDLALNDDVDDKAASSGSRPLQRQSHEDV
ncbi:hypothetical protein D9756_001074 [Leucocoprinus leucothites]|uniref:Rhodopsin domain-containing protein n=1 Tax=Leucocoprinus leucothites TaxID=201217 RepID=A0A8H5LMU1_9AGAR|nr:hypothetical protein D9756_001074 [Leucoagaricus leucothites]